METRIFKGLRAALVGVMVLSLSMPSSWARVSDRTYRAEAVTVVGQEEISERYAKVPGTYNVVTAEQIANLKPTDVTEVIRRIPGVNYADEDGRGFKPNIGLRGLDPSRSRNVLILLDGFPVQPSSYGDPAAYYNVPIENIERIDVVKGPASLLYHSNNLGGVINYITKRPPDNKKIEVTNQETFGEDSLFISETSAAGKLNDLSYRVSYLRKQGEGFRESDAFGVHDVGVYLNYQINDHSELTSRTYWYYEDSDTPGGLNRFQFNSDPLQSNTPDDNFEGRRVHTNLTYHNQFTDNQSFDSYFYYTFLSRDWFIASTVPSGNTQFKRDFNVFGFGANYEILYDVFGMEDNRFTVGIDHYFDHEDDWSDRGDTPTATSGIRTADNDLSTYAFDVYATTSLNVTDRFRVAPVVRMDLVRNGVENNLLMTEGSDTMAVWSPGVGAEYDLLEQAQIYASYHRSFQPAEYKEGINPTTGSTEDLDAQRGNHFEVGVRTDPLPWLEADVAIFTFDFSNEIISESGRRTNGQDTRHSGIESVIALDVFHMISDVINRETPDYLGTLRTDFSFTLLDTDFRKGPNSGNELPQAPNWQYNWGLHYDHPFGFYANLYGQWVDEQYSDAANTRDENPAATTGIIPGYQVWNLNVGYDFNDRFGVFFGVKNLFDEKYFSRRDTFFRGITPAPDQQIYFGTKIKLG